MASFEARNALKLAMRILEMQQEHLKRGGRAEGKGQPRLIQDQYPTQYMPNVGRQVMARGGDPEPPPMPEMPQAPQPRPSGLANIIRRGQPIDPQTPEPSPQEYQAAMADTRKGADVVARRLNVLVPERDRVAGGRYTPGAPGGGRWADMPEKILNSPGLGFNVSDDELKRLWQDAVSRSSNAAKAAVQEHNVNPLFLAKDWDKAMRLPLRDHLWYELSGEKLAENMPDVEPHEFMHLMDLIGATSARAKPGDNLERSLGVMSQNMRGVPVDVDLTIPETVRQALARKGMESSALPGNKTGYFSDTLALTGGVPTRFPISVNDVWVGKMFGVPDDVMSSNQSLHEPMAIYFNNIRDLYNQRHGHNAPFQYQSWNFQAPAWVHLRGEEAGEESGDAYHQVWGGIINKLKAAGIPGIEGDKITREALMHPDFADALRRTTKSWRDAPKATVEFGTKLTNVGEQAHALYKKALEIGDDKSAQEYLNVLTTAMYASARGKDHPWERLKKAITGVTGAEGDITRISHPTSDKLLDVGGSFEGEISPNIRVPLQGLSGPQQEYFNAIVGKHTKQKSMAISTIRDVVAGSQPRENTIRTHSVFVPTTEQMDPNDIRAFGKALDDEGHTFSYNRYPNGYRFDVNPAFDDNGARGIDEDKLAGVYGNVLEQKYGAGKYFPIDFSSEYTEEPRYGSLRSKLIKEIQNDFLKEAAARGIDASAARQALRSTGYPTGLPGGAKKAWDRYRTRIDHLSAAEAQFKALAQRVADGHADFVERAQRRQAKMLSQMPKEPDQMARGGRTDDDFGRHPAHGIPGIHIVGHDPVFTGRR